MKIDCRGHAMHVTRIEKALESNIRIWRKILSDYPEKLAPIFSHPFYGESSCAECGEAPEFRTLDLGETFVAESECIYKNGFPPIEVNLEVSSGEILLFNNFRSSYEGPKENININTTLGIKQYTEHYAKQGLIMHFVGNTCPSVIQVNNERLEIGNFYCEKEDGCNLPSCPMPSCNRPNEIGSICTDLWWYCAVDKGAFENRIGKTVEQYQEEYHARGAWPDIIRAKVTPGTYRTVGQYHIDNEKLFSFIEKIC